MSFNHCIGMPSSSFYNTYSIERICIKPQKNQPLIGTNNMYKEFEEYEENCQEKEKFMKYLEHKYGTSGFSYALGDLAYQVYKIQKQLAKKPRNKQTDKEEVKE